MNLEGIALAATLLVKGSTMEAQGCLLLLVHEHDTSVRYHCWAE